MYDPTVLPLDLTGKHALVCGASQGIGLAAAQQLAGLGAQVTLLARNLERLQAALATLPGEGHAVAVADFQDPADVTRALGVIWSPWILPVTVTSTFRYFQYDKYLGKYTDARWLACVGGHK